MFFDQKLHRYIYPLGVICLLALSACFPRRDRSVVDEPQSPILVAREELQADSLRLPVLAPVMDSLREPTSPLVQPASVMDSPSRDSIAEDSLSVLVDTLAGARSLESLDTLGVDTLSRQIDPSLNAFDDIIEYKAQDSMVLLGRSMAYLFGPSTVDYKDKGMEANFMRLNLDSNLIYAHYILDSTGQASSYPKFKDGSENYEAKSMSYNLKTAKGFITGVVTQQGEGYVTAERTKKADESCMYMEGGRYTTCSDHDHPHFYFKITRGKMRQSKNIVTGPVYLVFADVPLPIGLPFGFFPFSSTYSSGIIMPSYGEEASRGLYLKGGGYYWAINDYVDLAATGDWYSRGSWGVNLRSNYRKRYRYGGSLNINYLVTKTGDKDVAGDFSSSKDFRISWTHTQDPKASPSSSFSASVNFSTSSYNHNSLNTLYNPMISGQNTKSSSISYSKTFVGTPFRLSASMDVSQNSVDSMISLSLPNISLSMSRLQPFKRKKRVGSERWYERISLSYSGQFRNSIHTKEHKLLGSNLVKDWNNGFSHSIPVSASYKLFDYIDLTLGASYTERWYSYKTLQSYDPATDKIVKERQYGFNRAYNFGTSLSLNTTLYGFFKPWRIFGDKLQMIRHRMTPSIGISYTPDFGDPKWGNWRRLHYVDKEGRARVLDYSLYEGQVFGAPGRGKSASINFSLDNNIEAKLRVKSDTTETFEKVSIIDNFALSSSYNMAADSFQLSDINARIALKLPGNINLNLSGSFDPYLYGHTVGPQGQINVHRVNKLRILSGKGFGSLRGTGTSFSYALNNDSFVKLIRLFSGKKDKGEENKQEGKGQKNKRDPMESQKSNRDTSLGQMASENNQDRQSSGGSLYDKSRQDEGEYDADGYLKNKIPWNVSLSYGVNLNRASFDPKRDEYNYRLQHSLMFSGNIQPTKNWTFNFNASYDFERNKLANLTIGISRDLHCWSLTASLIPIGPYKSYNITIGVKSSMLKDLKWDKHSYPNRAAAW